MQSLKVSQAWLVSLITQLMAEAFNRTSWLARSLKGTVRLIAISPCVHEMESGSQFFTEMLTDEAKRSGDLKLKESERQVVSQNVLAVLPLLLLHEANKAEARAIKKSLFIQIS